MDRGRGSEDEEESGGNNVFSQNDCAFERIAISSRTDLTGIMNGVVQEPKGRE